MLRGRHYRTGVWSDEGSVEMRMGLPGVEWRLNAKRRCIRFQLLCNRLQQTVRLQPTHIYYLSFLRPGVQAQQSWVLSSGSHEASVDVSYTGFPSGTPKPAQCVPCDCRTEVLFSFWAVCPWHLATRGQPWSLARVPHRCHIVVVWLPGQQEVRLWLLSQHLDSLSKNSLIRAGPPRTIFCLMNLAD